MPINKNLNETVESQTNISIPRSRFQKTYETLTTFNPGYWFPVNVQEVLPGETIKNDVRVLARMLTPVTPTMDDCYLDVATFFVPCRLCTSLPGQFEKMMGAVGEPDAWTKTLGGDDLFSDAANYVSFNGPNDATSQIQSMSLANYLGLPIYHQDVPSGSNYSVSAVSFLPFRAVQRIWNEWLRDENLIPSVSFESDEAWAYCTKPLSEVSKSTSLLHQFMAARKLKDYFTSALPAPQKGAVTSLSFAGVTAPVVTSSQNNVTYHNAPLKWADPSTGAAPTVNGQLYSLAQSGSLPITVHGAASTPSSYGALTPANLVADLSNATGLTANDIRMVFGIQRLQEKLARGGSRWNEYLHALYGVQVNPGLVNMSVYLGGFTVNINTQEVVQTSGTTDVSPLGFPGAQSVNFGSSSFSSSFQEHGYVITLATARVHQSYSQGISPLWRRMRFYDWFSPTLSFIGEQPIYGEELYASIESRRFDDDGTALTLAPIFGYKEAWEEYRKPLKMVTGNFAPDAKDATLSVWTYTTNFANMPHLNSGFIVENPSQLLQTLAQTDTKTAFIGDFAILCDDYTPVPLNGFPGLVDHF